MQANQFRRLAILGAVLITSTACQDLDVDNLNAPDRTRALAQSKDLESLLAGANEIWFNAIAGTLSSGPNQVIGVMGAEMTAVESAATEVTEEPRRGFRTDDAPGGPAQHIAVLWRSAHQMSSNVHDYLRTVEELGLTINEAGKDVTPRANAYAKFMQGMGWGYQAVIFDQGIFLPETTPLSNSVAEQARDHMKPWPVGLTMALQSLDQAIVIAQKNNVTFPATTTAGRWFGTSTAVSTVTFVQYANTLAARFLVESARTPAERAKVDWNRVLAYTAGGLTTDIEMRLASGVRANLYIGRLENNAAGCTSASCMRIRYQLIGPADVSGAYQRWLGQSIAMKDRFDIVTPDRRITGPKPQSTGAYVTWWADNNGFASALGHYRRSAYQWTRHRNKGFFANTGSFPVATADENRLLRAEALIHLGRLSEAADLINVTRTRSHRLPDGITYAGLPPVTAAGVPQSANCVPRTDAGACGDVLVALRYERMLELIGMNTIRGWSDARGFGMLPEGTNVQYPVTSSEMQAIGLTEYTFGGVGTPFGAKYNPVTLANFK